MSTRGISWLEQQYLTNRYDCCSVVSGLITVRPLIFQMKIIFFQDSPPCWFSTNRYDSRIKRTDLTAVTGLTAVVSTI